jgi:hypothetical protein
LLKTQQANALARQIPSTLPIMLPTFIQIVLATIQLYAEAQLLTVEIHHIRRHRVLTTELATGQLPAAQVAPEQRLGIGGFAPELAREFELVGF